MIKNNFSEYTFIVYSDDYDSFTFPSGVEDHVKLNQNFKNKMEEYIIGSFDGYKSVLIDFRFREDGKSSLMSLFLLTDALRNYKNVDKIGLYIPYLPFARQDRVMVNGEPFSLKVFADMINLQNYSSVFMFDPHSDVAPALINNSVVIKNSKFVSDAIKEFGINDYYMISPDAGSYKKISDVCKYIGYKGDISLCNKKRDVSTGNIIGTYCDISDYGGKDCVIVDDICDGGGTFKLLAQELKKRNCGKLYLIVSHGIFSKGIETLLEDFEMVATTDSFPSNTIRCKNPKFICQRI